MAISIIFDGTAVFYTVKFKGLQAHPMFIFCAISLSNFCFMWPTLIGSFVCNLELPTIYRYTSFYDINASFNSLTTLVTAVPFQISFWYNMVIMLNIVLCLDLILTFRSPFKKPETRYPIYIVVSILLSITPAFIRTYALRHQFGEYLYGWIIIISFIVYVLIAIWSIFYAFKFLNRPGMSSTARVMITRRHVSYIVANILCQAYNVFSKFTTNLDPTKTYNINVMTPFIILYFG